MYVLIIAAAVIFCVFGGITLLSGLYSLNGIKAKTVGDGQHGTARWAGKRQIKKTYRHIRFTPKQWRKQAESGKTPTGKNGKPLPQGIVVGCTGPKRRTTAMIETGDVHVLMIGAAGVGKTAYWLYPCLEYACATGMSFLSTDTKGDLVRNYGTIAEQCYGYHVSVIDLRNPTRSNGNNLLHLVNKYHDMYEREPDKLVYKAKAEKYAKIIAKTIIMAGMDGANFGQNAYFYDAAEGLLTATILLVAEFCESEERHIVSVFKVIQELLAPGNKKGKNQFQQLMELLPDTHKAKWFAGAALNTAEQSMASVMSTALSRLNAFLDTELEQMLCFDTEIDTERFCKEKCAVFLIMPEEDPSKFFMVSLLIQQMYREILAVADETGGRLENRCVFFCDEYGTLPKIESAEMMFSAARSRRLQIVPIIQSFAQLERNYGKESAEIIIDNTQVTLFGGFAPNSSSAETLSNAMGSRTVLSGSVSRGKNDPSQSLQMIERPLMTPDELKSMPKGQFVVMKTGFYPMKVNLKLFFDWGISFGKPYGLEERGSRDVKYASQDKLIEKIIKKYHPEWLLYDTNATTMDELMKDALERYSQVKSKAPEPEEKPKKKTGGKKKNVVLKVERTASETEAPVEETEKEIIVEPEAGKDG